MPMNGRDVSVCIPAKDEAETIEEIITGCRPHADHLFVVDGHSSGCHPKPGLRRWTSRSSWTPGAVRAARCAKRLLGRRATSW